jgi:hypothetical protein
VKACPSSFKSGRAQSFRWIGAGIDGRTRGGVSRYSYGQTQELGTPRVLGATLPSGRRDGKLGRAGRWYLPARQGRVSSRTTGMLFGRASTSRRRSRKSLASRVPQRLSLERALRATSAVHGRSFGSRRAAPRLGGLIHLRLKIGGDRPTPTPWSTCIMCVPRRWHRRLCPCDAPWEERSGNRRPARLARTLR